MAAQGHTVRRRPGLLQWAALQSWCPAPGPVRTRASHASLSRSQARDTRKGLEVPGVSRGRSRTPLVTLLSHSFRNWDTVSTPGLAP